MVMGMALQKKKETVKIACMPSLSAQKILSSELAWIIKQGFVQNVLLVFYGCQVCPHTETSLVNANDSTILSSFSILTMIALKMTT